MIDADLIARGAALALVAGTNLVDIGRSFRGMGQSTMRDGACQRSPIHQPQGLSASGPRHF